MQVSVSLHEIISWIIAVASITLFFVERKKNNLTPFYMNLQGILKACHAKAVYYSQVVRHFEQKNNQEDPDLVIMWKGASYDFEALKQSVMGVMKAIEPNKDTPFDDRDYTSQGVKSSNENISSKKSKNT